MGELRLGSLFSGAGGLDLAIEAALGARTIWQCEVEPSAAAVLAAHWPDVPNLGDITAVDWEWVEPVDVLCGGFPCQDLSVAGGRAGIRTGSRSGLWSYMAAAVDALRPPLVVIENVEGLLSARAHRTVERGDANLGVGSVQPVLRAAGAVLGDLAELGYDARWKTVAAADVGAPHRRQRVFLLAFDSRRTATQWEASIAGGRRQLERSGAGPIAALLPTPNAQDGNGGKQRSEAALAAGNHQANLTDIARLLPTPCARDYKDATASPSVRARHTPSLGAVADYLPQPPYLPTPKSSDGLRQDCEAERRRHTPSLVAIEHYLPTPNAAECTGGGMRPDAPGRQGHSRQLIDYALLHGSPQWGKYEPAIRRWEGVTRPAPSPTEPNTKGNPRLAATFSEWMMGWPDGWVTAVPRMTRSNALRVIGNGVVPQQAYAAVLELLATPCGG